MIVKKLGALNKMEPELHGTCI